MRRLTRLPLALPVQEPFGDLELLGLLDDGHKLLHLILRQLARPKKRTKAAQVSDIKRIHDPWNPLKTLETGASGFRRGVNLPLVGVDLSLFADEVGEPPANTLNLAEGEHDLAPAIDVSVQHTKNVLKVRAHHKSRL